MVRYYCLLQNNEIDKMNILFLTMVNKNVEQRDIYSDLMRKFRDNGHDVYIVMPCERREGKPTNYSDQNGVHTLSVRTLNLQKTNIVEKGVGQMSLEYLYQYAIKKYYKSVKFDLILYSTPPITFTKVIALAKKENPEAKTYLMLKDIFPQNAVDLGMLSISGLKGLLYKSFRKKEKRLYELSDFIGCMSPANVKYVLKHNPEVDVSKVEICPNSFEPNAMIGSLKEGEREKIRQKHGLPTDKMIFFYGGNLGKPQGIPFLIECLDANKKREDCHFLVLGDGFDYRLLKKWYENNLPKNVTLMQILPKEDYDKLANACDVGLIFLDYRFTIPNYPSRLLNCLMQKKPIIACTDPNCDTGTLANENGYGIWAPSNSVEAFSEAVNKMLASDIKEMGEKGYQFYLNNYTTQCSYDAIMKHFN